MTDKQHPTYTDPVARAADEAAAAKVQALREQIARNALKSGTPQTKWLRK